MADGAWRWSQFAGRGVTEESGCLQDIAGKLDRKGKEAGEEATVAATTYRVMDALHAAVGGQGKLAACRYLVETVKIDVNMWDSSPSKKTPLEQAVVVGNLPALRYLLDHGADLAQEGDEGDDGLTVLHHAARKGTTTNATPTATDVSLFFFFERKGFPPCPILFQNEATESYKQHQDSNRLK
uniref:Predicted protein n=1 Tax=Hordeum vulgare subsp. vulgare TaxID=112509 RepID=F2DIX7_HORVV|nr:predicted protein [Hordeum vulgare subsp. vulgare]